LPEKNEVLELFSESLQLLNDRGVRIISRDGRRFALWRDADGPEVRDALDALGHLDRTILYLDDPYTGIEEQYWNCYVPQYVKEIWSRLGLLASPYDRREAEAKARRINAYFNSPFTYGTPATGCPPPTLISTFVSGTSSEASVNRTWRLSPALR